MGTIVSWIKKNKIATVLFIVLVFMIWKGWKTPQPLSLPSSGIARMERGISATTESYDQGAPNGKIMMPPIAPGGVAPAPDVQNRLVVQNSYLSLLVKNVRETVDRIVAHAVSQGGYMVNSNLENPGEAPSATVTIRVPSATLSQTLTFLRELSIRVVSENLTGEDVTDQYVDNQARLATLLQTKTKFEDIFNRATEISDITNIQRELINLQSQIDAVKGQQQYFEQTAKTAKITIYLSTDELALPYAPSDAWRPSVIFKEAVRSLILHVRSVVNTVIWLAVYGVIWIPAAAIFFFILKRRTK